MLSESENILSETVGGLLANQYLITLFNYQWKYNKDNIFINIWSKFPFFNFDF